MIKPEHHESRSVESMKGFLARLPSTKHEPKLFYDARFAEVQGKQEGDMPQNKVFCLAELTVQHHGSAYGDYQSVTESSEHKVLMYVQGRHMNDDFLVVGHQIDNENKLIHPAHLSLQDLVGYKELEIFEE